MSEDRELEDIKRRMLERLVKESAKPSLLVSGVVNVLTDATFNDAIASTMKPVLVDFWASWCSPCRMMSPVVEELAKEYAGRALFAKLNTDENQVTSTRFGVMSIPNFIIFREGRPIDRVIGAVGRQGLEATLSKHLSS